MVHWGLSSWMVWIHHACTPCSLKIASVFREFLLDFLCIVFGGGTTVFNEWNDLFPTTYLRRKNTLHSLLLKSVAWIDGKAIVPFSISNRGERESSIKVTTEQGKGVLLRSSETGCRLRYGHFATQVYPGCKEIPVWRVLQEFLRIFFISRRF